VIRIPGYQFLFHDHTLPVTISIGLAERKETLDEPASLIVGRADKALYQAKQEGSNRISSLAEPHH
jgi:PleD family two-component response regulator